MDTNMNKEAPLIYEHPVCGDCDNVDGYFGNTVVCEIAGFPYPYKDGPACEDFELREDIRQDRK